MPHGFPSDLGWKIFLDRYTLKDPERRFQAGDIAVVTTVEDPRWPQRQAAEVLAVDGDTIRVRILTGPEAGQERVHKRRECDRALETTLASAAQRIARGVAKVEKDDVRSHWQERFTEEISALRFVPAGRIWMGAGTGQAVTLENCFVLPCPRDSREGIVKTLGEMIETMARGGGVGINISSLRPAHAPVYGVSGRSSGAASWMDLYSRATGLVEQGGNRRGALMLQMDDWHPDIFRFINAKRAPGMVENANISVRVSDALMEAVKSDGDWDLVFPDTRDPDYDAIWDGNLKAWKARGKPGSRGHACPRLPVVSVARD